MLEVLLESKVFSAVADGREEIAEMSQVKPRNHYGSKVLDDSVEGTAKTRRSPPHFWRRH